MVSSASMLLLAGINQTIYWLFQVGFRAIAEALGVAAVKAVVAITAIIAGGRLVTPPYF